MSNKSRLQTNNTNLESLIDKANALPEAGNDSGDSDSNLSYGTCTVTLVPNGIGSSSIFTTIKATVISSTNTITDLAFSYRKTGGTTVLQGSILKGSSLVFGSGNIVGLNNCTVDSDKVSVRMSADKSMLVCEIRYDAPDAITITLS